MIFKDKPHVYFHTDLRILDQHLCRRFPFCTKPGMQLRWWSISCVLVYCCSALIPRIVISKRVLRYYGMFCTKMIFAATTERLGFWLQCSAKLRWKWLVLKANLQCFGWDPGVAADGRESCLLQHRVYLIPLKMSLFVVHFTYLVYQSEI